LALCNGWTTGVEKAQNLLIAMEGAAAETVRGLTAGKDEDYDLIWENLSRRFGHIDEPEGAKRRFDNKKQLESETIEVFEQGLRTVFRVAWPTGDPKSKENDSMLHCRFIDGLFNPGSGAGQNIQTLGNCLQRILAGSPHGVKFFPI